MQRIILIIFLFFTSAQEWEKSFTAGTLDFNNNYMGGSEVLQLVSHKNELFASVGYWQDELNIWYGGDDINYGWGQILKLSGSAEDWAVDLNLDSYYLRPEILKQVTFTKDMLGNNLSNPDTLLIAAAFSSNFIFGPVTANSFIRDDENNSWNISTIYEGDQPTENESYSIRDIQIYTDQITGIEMLFTTVGTKGIFVGKYNQDLNHKIQWAPIPEFDDIDIRPLGIVVANNELYFSSGNKIYKRIDGFNPSYTIIHDFSDLNSNINPAVGGIRGLTTINHNNDDSLILMWCPDSQSKGTIFRLDPTANNDFNRVYETKLSLLVEEYLPGTSVNYLLGAYNEFYKIYDNVDDEYVHFIGFEATIQGGNYPTWNGYYSGALYASKFSDKPNTDATSLGVYETGESYIGKHGLSMRLIGLDKGFNDTAYKRDIVMHSASYVNQSFIDKYHRIGRSWGCPAVSPEMIRPLVSTLEKGSILVIYYPDDRWLSESAFLKDK
mgnify:CR=1 FL=1